MRLLPLAEDVTRTMARSVSAMSVGTFRKQLGPSPEVGLQLRMRRGFL